MADTLKSIRVHGKGKDKYDNIRLGINGRLDTLQAAILLPKLEVFPQELASRRQIAQNYNDLISAKNNSLILPAIFSGLKSAWAQYSLLAPNTQARQNILDRLQEHSIPTAVYYPTPLHLQTAFSYLGYTKGDMPVSEDCAERIFSIPMHPYLKDSDLNRICSLL